MSKKRLDRIAQSVSKWLSRNNVNLIADQPAEELHLVSLEERVLYSAVPLPVDLAEPVDTGADAIEAIDVFENVEHGFEQINEGIEQLFIDDVASDSLDLADSELQSNEIGEERFELVLVDQSVEGFQQLVDDILNGPGNQDTHYEIAFVGSSSNGIQQISQILDSQTNENKTYNAVHLVTHGSDATLNLGNAQVNGANLDSFSQDVAGWQTALSDDADVLIYGCNVAASEAGEEFVAELARLTGADVAASNDLTGHDSMGGDWNFELAVGIVETKVAFTSELQASWMHSLAGEETASESGGATGRSVAVNDSQTVVQVFAHDDGSGNGLDIFYQITDATTGTQTPVLVSDGVESVEDQYWASVALANDGNFVVVWTSDVSSSGQEVFAKYYSADGSVIRDQFQVSAPGSGGNDASVAMDANGNFVVAWEGSGALDSDGIYAQRFDNNGTQVNGTFLVNDVADAFLQQGNADVAMNDAGHFVIAWDTYASDAVESNIYTQLYHASGSAVGAANTLVDSDFGIVYSDASVAMNNAGNFVVAYTSDATSGNKILTGNVGLDIGILQNIVVGSGIEASTYNYDNSSIKLLSGFSVNETISGDQANASVTILNNDTLTVVWDGAGVAEDESGSNSFNTDAVFKRNFDLSGAAMAGQEFVDASTISGQQHSAAIASNGSDFAIAFDDGADALALDLSYNYTPTASNSTVTVASGFQYTFTLNDFAYFDADNNAMDHILLESVPDHTIGQGQLLRNGTLLVAGDQVFRSEIDNGEIIYQSMPNSIGNIANLQYRASDGNDSSNTATIQIEAEYTESLLFSTAGSHSMNGTNWDGGDIVAFGGSDFTLGSPTTGDAYATFSTNFDLDALHFANSETVLDFVPAVTVEQGDVIFSVENSTSDIPGISSTSPGDVILFQPASPTDYTPANGTFSVLLTVPGGNELLGITVVEKDTMVGDTIVEQGSLLFIDDSSPTDIQVLEINSGALNKQTLFVGSDVGISSDLMGLELVEANKTIGGQDLIEGTVLVSVKSNNNNIGTNTGEQTNAQDNDIFALQINTTQVGSGNSTADARILFDASTVAGLAGGPSGDIDAISMFTSRNEQQLVNNNAITLDEGQTVVLDSSQLLTADSDTPNNQLVYSLATSPTHGELLLDGATTLEFTQADVNNGRVSYQHSGGEQVSVTVSVSVDDGFGAVTDLNLQFDINPVNDSPILTQNQTPTFDEGSIGNVITSAMLSAIDADNAADEIIFTLDDAPKSGKLFNGGLEIQVTDQFTQEDIDNGLITYSHNGDEIDTDSFEFTVKDGGEDGATQTTDQLVISLDPVNDVPQFSVSTFNVNEGSTGNIIPPVVLDANDVDPTDTADQLTYTLQNGPLDGNLLLNGIQLSPGQSFTQQDVIDGNVTYDHNGGSDPADQIELVLEDGLEDGVTGQAVTLDIAVSQINDAPFDLSNGVEINADGDSSYFHTAQGDVLFGNVDEFTYEISFSSTNVGENMTLASYRSPSDTTSNDDAFRLSLRNSGALVFTINGENVSSNGMDFSQIIDGGLHSLAFSWTAESGHWEIHVDGVRVDDGYGLATAQSIRGGGEFVIGHEQDVVDGGYATNNEFKGTVHDVRIWDAERSTTELENNINTKFESGNLPTGLVANWQFSNLDAGQIVVDIASNADLTLQQVANNGFTNSDAREYMNVDENASNGTIVGHVVANDSDYFDDVVIDGSFTNADEPGNPNFHEYVAGEFVGDWEVVNNGVDLRGADWETSPEGGRAIDLVADSGRGTIRQTIDTVVGQTYEITFEVSGNFEGFESFQSLDVLVDGSSNNFLFNEPAGWSRTNLQWESRTLNFTATSTTTELAFEGTSGFRRGAIISDVVVAQTSSPDASANTYSLLDDANGRFTIDSSTGEISVADSSQLDFESNMSHTVEIEVEDKDGLKYSEFVKIEINNENEAPVVNVASVNVAEGQVDAVVSNASLNAVDPDTLRANVVYTVTQVPNNGSLDLLGVTLNDGDTFSQVDIDNGSVTYTHFGGENANDVVELSVLDDASGRVAQDVSLAFDISQVNDAPVVNDNDLGIIGSGQTTILQSELLGNDSDPDGDTLLLDSFTQPANGTLSLTHSGDLLYTPNTGFSGPDSFQYNVSDGTSNQSTGSVNFIVNDIPAAVGESFMTTLESTLSNTVAGNESDNFGSGLLYEVESGPNTGDFLFEKDGSFLYTPADGFFGTESFTYKVFDGLEYSETVEVDLSVFAQPRAADDYVIIAYGESPQIFVFGNDIDLDNNLGTSKLSIISDVSYGSLSRDATGVFTYYQANKSATQDSFTYQITDLDGLSSNVATVYIQINHAPQIASFSGGSVDENSAVGTFVADVDASDLNNDIVEFELVDDDGVDSNNLFEIDPNTGDITVANSALLDFENTPSQDLEILVTDSAGLTTSKKMTVTINPVDEAPEAAPLTRTVSEGAAIAGSLSDVVSDPESDIDAYHLIDGPSHGTLELKPDGNWEYQHNDTENFVDQFTFAVRDLAGNMTQSTVNLNVTPVDDAPIAIQDVFVTDAATSVEMNSDDLLGNDVNVDESTQIEIVTLPGSGELVQNLDGTLTFVPDPVTSGFEFFEYRIHVDDQVSATARVTFNIIQVAQGPTTTTTTTTGGLPTVNEVPSAETPPVEPTEPDPEPETETTDPVEEISTPPEEEILQGPILSSDGGISTENDDQDSLTGFDSFNEKNSEEAEEAAQAAKRSLLWQPRYAVLGNQLQVTTTLSHTSSSELAAAEYLEEFTGVAYGLSGEFLEELDGQSVGQSMQFSDIPILTFSTSSLLTVGYLVWAIRAGALVSTFISMPAWTQFDPLPVIEKGIPVNFGEDDDSLEKLVDTV